MEKYICIHAHFYQPPRENPWLEAIEIQDSAHPYHDWNERITAECYATNMKSRILDGKGRITAFVNNYAKISFNVGPTLMSWLKDYSPDVYAAVIEADRESAERFSGHGSAMAQVYNHMILPLANPRDKKTQVIWGIRDFEHRFGRKPEGMWLPETAVDLDSLEVLAEHGIRFTILAPHQARRVRILGKKKWKDLDGGKIDPTTAYSIRLPSGRQMALFFYDGPVSRAIAFEKLLNSGEVFAGRLAKAFSDERDHPQLVHIATDGETYGHHHRHGEMALSFALHHIESNELSRLTNYGEFLEKHPPTREVEILDDTSWSCAHGIERWRNDCGCCSGGRPEWNQKWRAPLREALDWLRDELASIFASKGERLLEDPWKARDDYIAVILDRSPEAFERFLADHAKGSIEGSDRVIVRKLLELERHAMLMYTSCGWFFDELSGIETVQIIQYAARALQLAGDVSGGSLEGPFLERLGKVPSNLSHLKNGREVFERYVRPATVSLRKVAAHFAMTSLFEDHGDDTSIYCYNAQKEDFQVSEAGKARMVAGKVRITSQITHDENLFSFGVLHSGDHNLTCGVRAHMGDDVYEKCKEDLFKAFSAAEFAKTIRELDRHFDQAVFSLRSLFKNEQRRILNQILDSTLQEAEANYRQLYDNYAPLIRFLRETDAPVPEALYASAELVLNATLRRIFEDEDGLDLDAARSLLEEAESQNILLNESQLEYPMRRSLERMASGLRDDPENRELLEELDSAAGLMESMPFLVNLWTIQNRYHELLENSYPNVKERAEQGEEEARKWIEGFAALGEKLYVKVS